MRSLERKSHSNRVKELPRTQAKRRPNVKVGRLHECIAEEL